MQKSPRAEAVFANLSLRLANPARDSSKELLSFPMFLCSSPRGVEKESSWRCWHFPELYPGSGRKVGGRKGLFAKRGALNGSTCKPALLEGVFPSISLHVPPSMCRSPFLSRGCWKMDLLPVHMYLYCQCIFILARFRRRFVGLSAQVGISRPVFNASESTRLCTPSSSFLSCFQACPLSLPDNHHTGRWGVDTPGWVRGWEGLLRVSVMDPVPPPGIPYFLKPGIKPFQQCLYYCRVKS